MSSWVLSILNDGDSTSSPGNLCQCLTTLFLKNPFFPYISCCAQGMYLLVPCVCCPCMGQRHSTGSICLQVPQRCVATAPASRLAGRRWCLPSPLCLWESTSFQYTKGRAAQPGNAMWQFSYGNVSWLSSKMENSWL